MKQQRPNTVDVYSKIDSVSTLSDMAVDPEESTLRADLEYGLSRSKKYFGLKEIGVLWFQPACLLFVCFLMQNYGLYIGTYYYVMWMDRLELSLSPRTPALLHGERLLQSGTGTTPKLDMNMHRETLSSRIEQGALHDVVADVVGRIVVPYQVLDMLAGLVPMGLLVLSVMHKDLRVWTKCCLCASILALLKGFLAWATVVPDSIGWDGCKARLGEDGLNYFRHKGGLNFEQTFFRSLWDVFALEMFFFLPGQRHVRFCADMMFSGHTYLCGIFALGLYDLCRSQTATCEKWKRDLCRFCVGSLLSIMLLGTVMLILADRFHYTMDCVIALVLILLLFSNPSIALAVERYASQFDPVPVENCASRFDAPVHDQDFTADKERGAVLVPPCCLPFCCWSGRYHLHARPHKAEQYANELQDQKAKFETQHRDVCEQLRFERQHHEGQSNQIKKQLKTSKDELQQIKNRYLGKEMEILDQEKQAAKGRLEIESGKARDMQMRIDQGHEQLEHLNQVANKLAEEITGLKAKLG